MAYLGRKDRSLREEKFKSKELNFGIRTNDSAWVIDDQEMSDSSCVTYNIKSGFKSQKGQVIQNYNSGELGAYKLFRGGYFFDDRIIVAYSDNTETKVFQLVDGVYTALAGAKNSFNKDNIMDFAGYEGKLFMCDGENVIRVWDGVIANNIADLVDSGAGTVPVGAKKLRIWRDRLWAMASLTNPNEINASAVYDTTWWDAAIGNAGGDKGFSILVDNDLDFPLLSIEATMSTIGFYKGNSIHILVGTNESDWSIRQLPVDSGAISGRSIARSVEMVMYDSDVGIKGVKGSESLEASARYDVVQSLAISNPVKNAIDDLTEDERKNAFAVFYNDIYRCNYSDFVFRYNALGKGGEGCIEIDKATEVDIAGYIYDGINNRLYGITYNTGDVYQIEVGHSLYRWKPVEPFNDSTEWTVTDCVATDDSSIDHFVYDAGVNFAVTGADTGMAYKDSLSLDLENIGVSDDYIDFYVWLENANFTSLSLRFGADASNYFEKQFTVSDLSIGLQNKTILKTDFTATGSPSWDAIDRIDVVFVTTADNSVTLNLIRQRNNGNYTKDAITKSYSFPPFDEHIKNINEIRVWGRVNGSYPVKVDYYIDDSITASGSFEIDLSSTFFGYYLSDAGLSTDAGINFIEDTSKSWTNDEWAGQYVYMRATNELRVITGNTADTLYIDGIGVSYNTVGDIVSSGFWYHKDYCIVPATNCFYTHDSGSDSLYTANYGGGFSNVEFKERPFLRGKRIKLRFYTDEANQEFEIFGFQIVYEVLQHKP
jgi:hypothetical protein